MARTADETLAARVRHSAPGSKTVLVKDPPGFEKLSGILAEFAKPLIQQAKTRKDYKTALGLATIAWNAALVPEEERAQMLRGKEMVDALGPVGIELMEKLIARKLALFADEKRPILDFELVDRGGGQFYLTVTSEIPGHDPRARPLLEAKGLLPPAG
jgi:hypothetical protein